MGYEMTAVEWSEEHGYTYRLEEEDDMLRLSAFDETGQPDATIALEADAAIVIGNALVQMGMALAAWRERQEVEK